MKGSFEITNNETLGRMTLTCLYNHWSGEHHCTASGTEMDTMVKNGWKAEGIAWYGVKWGVLRLPPRPLRSSQRR